LVTAAYRYSIFNNNEIRIASVKAGNVIGGSDWSTERLIHDYVRSLYKNKIISIRNPNAIRSWQFVLKDIFGMLSLSLHLRENHTQFSEPWNFGHNSNKKITVKQIVKKIIR
jgi:CDP-glucose 4,6-dehydratase